MAYKQYILVCGGTACESNRGIELFAALKKAVEENGLVNDVQVVRTGCLGFCEKGPIVKILPQDTFYVEVKPEDAEEIVKEHLVKGRVVSRLLYDKNQSKRNVGIEGIDFYQKQFRIVLRNCGVIDPDKIDEYIARDGYKALEKALFEMKPRDVIDEVSKSGLRGRGGAGFPTGKKWEFAAVQPAGQKYMVCNADEGDPGAYMDRSTLEGDPHSVLEAMAIAGYSIGADTGFIYIRAEYPLAIQRLENAIKQAHEYGLLGKNILGSGFSFNIEIRLGAGAFVCGEETALLASIEGKRGMPSPRPPFPAVKGLWGCPTVINNVETLANIPVILLKGNLWFSKIGTATSKGTKVFALTGKINNSGLIEVPMGTTLREIIFDIGGGIKDGKGYKAVQTGGPMGGCLPTKYLDLEVDYETLGAAGSIMGSGGMVVMDEDTCMVDIARFFMEFTQEESCGKCVPCRVGTRRILEILERICAGEGIPEDIPMLRSLCDEIKQDSLCGLGQGAPNPVVSTLEHFLDEYEAHIYEKRCPAKVCRNLITYNITENCTGCTVCARNCPVNAITGERKQLHVIDQDACIRCGICFQVCNFDAVEVN